MKYKLKIETEWPNIAKKRGGFTYVDLFDWSLTPRVREHFFLDNGVVYEHRIMCPMLSLHPDKKLFKVEKIDPNTFILDTHCEWPVGISAESGFVAKERYNTGDCVYLYLHNDRQVTPSHLEINAMRKCYKELYDDIESHPLLTIEVIR
ncbi:hypothetical protein [Pectobacterium odoriferum]|uniref:hypothetical protein n=1 Tax=Pectobacterium odoriferum TaxID=78398 RepID=UPI000CD0E538|nr:hypothetical protein [Pectobacterium odoriferum]POE03350.1 hypothetical protein BVY05_05675 [Pectobacterium odoriferum]